jgi:predicted small secreted protein
MKLRLLPIALAISFLSLSGCSGVFGPKAPTMTPEEQAAQEKALADFEGVQGLSFQGTAESVILAACNDLYGFADGYIDYVRIMDCYHEQISEPEQPKGPRDLSPKSQSR